MRVSIGSLILATLAPTPSEAVPAEVRYRNPGTIAYEGIQIHDVDTGRFEFVAVACLGGATCALIAQLAPGERRLRLNALGAAGLVSPDSNTLTYVIPVPPGCEWDLDGGGTVNTADFGLFYAKFGKPGGYTVADFGRFLKAFSTPGLSCL